MEVLKGIAGEIRMQEDGYSNWKDGCGCAYQGEV
jgi:hypothetical protein